MNFDNLTFTQQFPDRGLYIQDEFLDIDKCEHILKLIEDYCKAHQIPSVYRKKIDRSLDYKVIDGEIIAQDFPEIEQIYQKIDNLINQKSSQDLVRLANIKAACNINITQPGGEYCWHYDRNLITGILYLNNVDGGETDCYPNYRMYIQKFRYSYLQRSLDSLFKLKIVRLLFGKKVSIKPTPGKLVLMYGIKCLHSVHSVLGDSDRIVLIFSFDLANAQFSNEQHLDAYIYGGQQQFKSDPNYLKS
jgi:2OG-Fe(II) oxygenase superfamily